MAYGLKYIATAYGLSESQWKLEIYEKDFTPTAGSSPIPLSLSGDGIKIGYDREEDRFNTIYSRYAIIDLKVTNSFNLDTLQFDDERKFWIKIYRGTIFEFSGWIIPNYSSQDYEDVSIVTISIQAKDSINRLRDIPFVDEYPILFSHKQSVKDLVSQALRNVGYNLDLEIYYNKYEDGMLKTSSDCPLSQLYINVKSFKEKDEWISYYDVIQRLLSDHDLRIFQANGKWIVLSSIELVDGSVSGRKFNYLGVYQSNVTLSSDLSLGLSGLGIKRNSIIRKGIPIQSFTANFEFGQSRNLVLNGSMENFSDFQPEGWTLSNNWVNGEVAENTGGGIIFRDTYATRSPSILPDVPINDASLNQNKYLESDQINIESLGTFSLSAETFISGGIDAARVRIEFYDEGGANKQYITSDGKLTFVPTSLYVYNDGTNSYKLLTLTWENKNQYGTPVGFKYMKVRVYEGIRLRSGVPETTEVKFRNVNISGRPINVSSDFIGKRVEIKNTDLPSSKKYSDLIFYYKDVELFNEPEHVHKLYLSNEIGETDISVGKWKRTAESTQRKLIDSKLIDRLSMTNKFGDIFEGSVFGYVGMNTTPYLEIDEKRLLVLYSEFSLGSNTTEIVAIELFANNFNVEKNEYNLFSNDTIIKVDGDSVFTTKVDVGETFEPITNAGGTIYGGLYTDKGIDSLPANSTDPRATNKGLLTLGSVNAQNIELGNRENLTLVEILGRFALRNQNNFIGEFSASNLTANRVATLPDRNIEINKWADLSGVPTTFTPAAHSHTIGDVTGLGTALDGKQPINGNLTSLASLATNGIVRRSGANTFTIGTNDPITLSGDVSGIGTTEITTTLSNTGVTAGTYRSVTVDAKGRVTAGTVPNYNSEWDARWTTKIANPIGFGSNITVNGLFTTIGQSYFNGNVGIGTLSPSSKFNVQSNINTNNSSINLITLSSDRNDYFSGIGIVRGTASTYLGISFFTSNNNTSSEVIRINPNGNLSIGTINDAYKLDVNGTGRFVGSVQFDSIATCSVAPTSPNHLTNKAYVDSLSFVKKGDNVKTISLTNITLSGTQTINGVSLIANDLILVAGQTTASQNGVYVVSSSTWTRSTTNDSDAEIRGAYHLITAGSYINQRYINTNSSTITVGVTAVTYTLDFGQESDPVWSAFQSANDITPTRISNWNTAYGWGNHANLYVDKVSTQTDIAGAKTFTTSVQSPILRAGTNSLNITLFNYFGTQPRIASNSTGLDFFAGTNFTWTTTDDIVRMKLTTAGLRVGNSDNPNFTLHISGSTGFGGLINVFNPENNTYSSGTDGQVLMMRSGPGFASNKWETLTVSTISDIDTYYVSKIYADANYVTRVTDEGERGFFMYGDTENTVKEAFLFTNPDTGIMGIHAFRLNGTNIEQYGFQLDKDGLPYWLFTDGSRKRILTELDLVNNGVTYTLAEPLYFFGTQINIRTASSTQTGVLTSTKFNDFNSKLGEGSTINTFLNFAFGQQLKFLSSSNSAIHTQYSSWDGENNFNELTNGKHTITASSDIFLNSGSGFVNINNVAIDTTNIPSLVGQNAKFLITSPSPGKYKATFVSA